MLWPLKFVVCGHGASRGDNSVHPVGSCSPLLLAVSCQPHSSHPKHEAEPVPLSPSLGCNGSNSVKPVQGGAAVLCAAAAGMLVPSAGDSHLPPSSSGGQPRCQQRCSGWEPVPALGAGTLQMGYCPSPSGLAVHCHQAACHMGADVFEELSLVTWGLIPLKSCLWLFPSLWPPDPVAHLSPSNQSLWH